MRDLRKNQVSIWYALYERKEPVKKNGHETGQYTEIFSDPVQVWISVAPATGASEAELFGASVQYDRVLSSVRPLPIDEYSRLWVEKTPTDGDHDYVVKRVAKGLNQNLWAIAKVVR